MLFQPRQLESVSAYQQQLLLDSMNVTCLSLPFHHVVVLINVFRPQTLTNDFKIAQEQGSAFVYSLRYLSFTQAAINRVVPTTLYEPALA